MTGYHDDGSTFKAATSVSGAKAGRCVLCIAPETRARADIKTGRDGRKKEKEGFFASLVRKGRTLTLRNYVRLLNTRRRGARSKEQELETRTDRQETRASKPDTRKEKIARQKKNSQTEFSDNDGDLTMT